MSILVLLVGMNPLPNWVVVQSLTMALTPPEWRAASVLVVHSPDTAAAADWVARAIRAKGIDVLSAELSRPRDGWTIRSEMRKRIAALGREAAIHLNYTGGTKEMAVSVYAAFNEAMLEHRIRAFSCSYLDAGEHKLRFDDRSVLPTALDLRQWVKLSLGQLLDMHGRVLERGEDRTSSPPFGTHTATAIWQAAVGDGGARDEYLAWRQTQVWDRRGTPDGAASDVVFALPIAPALASVAEAIRADLAMAAQETAVTWPRLYAAYGPSARRRDVRDDAPKLFGGGGWLEGWLWQQLHRLIRSRADWPLHHGVYAHGVNGGKNAELDVVLLCGYQLFVFSCTTDVGRCKEKAFEVLHRAEQYGGEEARAVVVAPLTATERRALLADMESDFGSARELRVWGIEEMRQIDREWALLVAEEGLQ